MDDRKLLAMKHLLALLGILVCALVPLSNIFEFKLFEMKILATLEFNLAWLVLFKFLAILANLKTFKLLKQRISNDDDYFEAEMSVELFYRKLGRIITFAFLVIHGSSIVILSVTHLYPNQLPYTE